MKVGILGGSFDPIHNGHLHMAKQALMEYDLDEVWIIPAGHSPNKDEYKMCSPIVRQKMCELACQDEENIRVNTIEMESDETSYTYRTLEKLTSLYPMHTFFFIMGADSLAYFKEWVHPEIISRLSTILVVNRGEYTEDELNVIANDINSIFPADIQIVHCDKYDISSSKLRQLLANGDNVAAYLNPKVLEFIQQKKIYM